MKKRLKVLLIGLFAGTAYATFTMLITDYFHQNVSISYIFLLPIVLGIIPVMLSTKEQLKSYTIYLVLPWIITLTFFLICFLLGYEGMICLIVIIAPFLVLGTVGAFIARLITLKENGKGTKLYFSLTIPFLFLFLESNLPAKDYVNTVNTTIEVEADKQTVWENIKNIRNIKPDEINTHFIHQVMRIPKPINGELDKEGVGGVRQITWEKGIKFQEIIKNWVEGERFDYDIKVDPSSIPPTTLDEHVMIGGRYFDVLEGSYQIKEMSPQKCIVQLSCTYRVTTNLNAYSKIWADFILNDFNDMILEVVKNRSELKANYGQ